MTGRLYFRKIISKFVEKNMNIYSEKSHFLFLSRNDPIRTVVKLMGPAFCAFLIYLDWYLNLREPSILDLISIREGLD